MANVDVLDILKVKNMSPLEFNFDSLCIPPMNCFLTQQDIDELRKIATSLRLSSKIDEKYRRIDNIMRARGFKRFAAGTNRVVYSFLEDDRFLVKIAVDRVGMKDNPMEYENQYFLKPYVTKMFYISPCGTVGFAERVLPIKNKEEFKEIASDVFDILTNKILGKYVVEDVGTKFFMNWGIRLGYGPVLLDYPYVYKLDGKKLFCSKQDLATGIMCNGEIDYDAGFNHLICTKCGKRYLATDLRDDTKVNKIIIKGGSQMKVSVTKGSEYLVKPLGVEEVMEKPKKKPTKSSGLRVSIAKPAHKEDNHNEMRHEEKRQFKVSMNSHKDDKRNDKSVETKLKDAIKRDKIASKDNLDEFMNTVENSIRDMIKVTHKAISSVIVMGSKESIAKIIGDFKINDKSSELFMHQVKSIDTPVMKVTCKFAIIDNAAAERLYIIPEVEDFDDEEEKDVIVEEESVKDDEYEDETSTNKQIEEKIKEDLADKDNDSAFMTFDDDYDDIKSSKPKRDSKGRFVSTKSSDDDEFLKTKTKSKKRISTKSNFID